jgi:hypothetical protein
MVREQLVGSHSHEYEHSKLDEVTAAQRQDWPRHRWQQVFGGDKQQIDSQENPNKYGHHASFLLT